jgi:two-component system chemotaxis response regulator CheY
MNYRVVIVDDAPFVREVLAHILRPTEFQVVDEASDGEEAVTKVLEAKPDLVIMDIVMPKKSGIQATLEIREQNQNIKIVACSTEGSEAIVARAIEAGCCDFIVKPFEAAALIKTLRSAVQGKTSVQGKEAP